MYNESKLNKQIIKLNRRNLKELAQLDLESNHEMESHMKLSDYKDLLNKRFNSGYEMFFGFKEDGVIKGYIALKPFFPGYNHCEVYWLSVRCSCQGQGIGTKLMTYIEQYAKREGFRKVCLYTNKMMTKTRKFYEKLGYKLVNEFPDYYGFKKNNTAVLYAKNI